MSATEPLRDPWLLAGWPGMGNVAILALSHLVDQLDVTRAGQIDSAPFFEVKSVQVTSGIASPARLPRNLFFEWRNPRAAQDLLIFIGEAQPVTGGYKLCQDVMNFAVARGVKRVCTFAAMANQLELGNQPKVFGAATDAHSLKLIKEVNTEILEGGQIGGLNGALLAAAVDRGVSGICLLGEIPYFAAEVPNPRAASAALEQFSRLTGVETDRSDLLAQAEAVEHQLQELLEKLQNQSQGRAEEEEDEFAASLENANAEAPPAAPPKPKIDPKTAQKIESLFEQAKSDRGKAIELKRELDRLGLFKEYENRFLDLFRHAAG